MYNVKFFVDGEKERIELTLDARTVVVRDVKPEDKHIHGAAYRRFQMTKPLVTDKTEEVVAEQPQGEKPKRTVKRRVARRKKAE